MVLRDIEPSQRTINRMTNIRKKGSHLVAVNFCLCNTISETHLFCFDDHLSNVSEVVRRSNIGGCDKLLLFVRFGGLGRHDEEEKVIEVRKKIE